MARPAPPPPATLEGRFERCRRMASEALAEASRVRARSVELRRVARARRERSGACRGHVAARLVAGRQSLDRMAALRQMMHRERDCLRERSGHPVPACRRQSATALETSPVPTLAACTGGNAADVYREWRGTGARAPGVVVTPDATPTPVPSHPDADGPTPSRPSAWKPAAHPGFKEAAA